MICALPMTTLSRLHTRRLRDVYRSAGWPWLDAVEVDLLAAGLLERRSEPGHETLRLTDAGLKVLSESLKRNRAALGHHESLVERTAQEMARAGRIVWRGLSLRSRVDDQWIVAKPDVFSVRHTTVEAYLYPIVHEIKVSRSDLLGDLRKPHKGQAYRQMAGECWFVLGCNVKAEPIAEADEIGSEYGVMLWRNNAFEVLRPAPRLEARLPFSTWLALARATPCELPLDQAQGMLGEEGAMPPE
jgi:hypothetical protein